MNRIEQFCRKVRHSRPLENATGLWNLVRPAHDLCWRVLARKGIRRNINGTDEMRISPRLRQMEDQYEPEVWSSLMREIRLGDTFVDVGAYIGLYTIGVARRLRGNGEVYGFEPDPDNYDLFCENLRLNQLDNCVCREQKALSAAPGKMRFRAGRRSESSLLPPSVTSGIEIEVITLQDYFKGKRIDVLKLDVEGYELDVLAGALGLLRCPTQRPRVMFVEVHPGRWAKTGTTSETVLKLLAGCGYAVYSTCGAEVLEIREYGEIIARVKPGSGR